VHLPHAFPTPLHAVLYIYYTTFVSFFPRTPLFTPHLWSHCAPALPGFLTCHLTHLILYVRHGSLHSFTLKSRCVFAFWWFSRRTLHSHRILSVADCVPHLFAHVLPHAFLQVAARFVAAPPHTAARLFSLRGICRFVYHVRLLIHFSSRYGTPFVSFARCDFTFLFTTYTRIFSHSFSLFVPRSVVCMHPLPHAVAFLLRCTLLLRLHRFYVCYVCVYTSCRIPVVHIWVRLFVLCALSSFRFHFLCCSFSLPFSATFCNGCYAHTRTHRTRVPLPFYFVPLPHTFVDLRSIVAFGRWIARVPHGCASCATHFYWDSTFTSFTGRLRAPRYYAPFHCVFLWIRCKLCGYAFSFLNHSRSCTMVYALRVASVVARAYHVQLIIFSLRLHVRTATRLRFVLFVPLVAVLHAGLLVLFTVFTFFTVCLVFNSRLRTCRCTPSLGFTFSHCRLSGHITSTVAWRAHAAGYRLSTVHCALAVPPGVAYAVACLLARLVAVLPHSFLRYRTDHALHFLRGLRTPLHLSFYWFFSRRLMFAAARVHAARCVLLRGFVTVPFFRISRSVRSHQNFRRFAVCFLTRFTRFIRSRNLACAEGAHVQFAVWPRWFAYCLRGSFAPHCTVFCFCTLTLHASFTHAPRSLILFFVAGRLHILPGPHVLDRLPFVRCLRLHAFACLGRARARAFHVRYLCGPPFPVPGCSCRRRLRIYRYVYRFDHTRVWTVPTFHFAFTRYLRFRTFGASILQHKLDYFSFDILFFVYIHLFIFSLHPHFHSFVHLVILTFLILHFISITHFCHLHFVILTYLVSLFSTPVTVHYYLHLSFRAGLHYSRSDHAARCVWNLFLGTLFDLAFRCISLRTWSLVVTIHAHFTILALSWVPLSHILYCRWCDHLPYLQLRRYAWMIHSVFICLPLLRIALRTLRLHFTHRLRLRSGSCGTRISFCSSFSFTHHRARTVTRVVRALPYAWILLRSPALRTITLDHTTFLVCIFVRIFADHGFPRLHSRLLHSITASVHTHVYLRSYLLPFSIGSVHFAEQHVLRAFTRFVDISRSPVDVVFHCDRIILLYLFCLAILAFTFSLSRSFTTACLSFCLFLLHSSARIPALVADPIFGVFMLLFLLHTSMLLFTPVVVGSHCVPHSIAHNPGITFHLLSYFCSLLSTFLVCSIPHVCLMYSIPLAPLPTFYISFLTTQAFSHSHFSYVSHLPPYPVASLLGAFSPPYGLPLFAHFWLHTAPYTRSFDFTCLVYTSVHVYIALRSRFHACRFGLHVSHFIFFCRFVAPGTTLGC